jgi:hypothetical protein
MTDNVQRGDIGGQDEQTLFALSERLDHLFDAALELTCLGGLFDQAEEAAGELGWGERGGDGQDGVCWDVECGGLGGGRGMGSDCLDFRQRVGGWTVDNRLTLSSSLSFLSFFSFFSFFSSVMDTSATPDTSLLFLSFLDFFFGVSSVGWERRERDGS